MKITIEWPMYFPSADGKDEVETIFEVECDLTPAEPDVPYLKNGDPGYPGSPGECEILSIKLQGLGQQPGIDLAPILWPLLGFQGNVLKQIEEKVIVEANDRGEDYDDPADWEPKNISQQDDPNDD